MRKNSQIQMIKYKIKDRWIEVGEDDNGFPILEINPDPTVVFSYGGYSMAEKKAIDVFDILASDFTKATGVIVYGGNIGQRGEVKISLESWRVDMLWKFAKQEKPNPPKKKKTFKEVEDRFQPKKHPLLKCRVRKK